jgi:DNA-binding protein YbaB
MNSLSKTFDEAMVTKDLEALEKMISEAMAKGKDKGAEGEAKAASGS